MNDINNEKLEKIVKDLFARHMILEEFTPDPKTKKYKCGDYESVIVVPSPILYNERNYEMVFFDNIYLLTQTVGQKDIVPQSGEQGDINYRYFVNFEGLQVVEFHKMRNDNQRLIELNPENRIYIAASTLLPYLRESQNALIRS
jgi:hypothetical protein